jgi:SRSO17 transposase
MSDLVTSRLDPTCFERRSCGHGTKGERYHDWAAIAVTVKDQSPSGGKAHTLLVRRSTSKPSEIEYFLAHAAPATPIPELIGVAGMRWKIEENNEHGKDLLGLGQYQVRKWTPWHRHVTTCMLAAAFLAVTRADLPDDLGKDPQPQEATTAR